jgi:tetratricopeptide (TPR) repeat protein
LLAVNSVTARAQPDKLALSVRLPNADLAPGTRGYRVYGLPTELPVVVVLSNHGARDVLASRSLLAGSLRFVLSSDAAALNAEWSSAFRRAGVPGDVTVAADTPVLVAPRQAIEWVVTVRRADAAPFSAGAATVNVDASQASGDLAVTHGIEPVPTSVVVTFGEPGDSPRERGAAHRQAGRIAQRTGDVAQAIQAFERAVAEEPSSVVSLTALGDARVAAKQYGQAIEPLEKVLSMRPRARTGVPFQLAQAYLATGKDSEAARVLQTAGIAPDRIASELATLRARLTSP